MGKLWDWHKKMFNTPVMSFSYVKNGQGSKAWNMNIVGSKFQYFEFPPLIEDEIEEPESMEFEEIDIEQPKKLPDLSKMKRINHWVDK